jgi:hypothetical protein
VDVVADEDATSWLLVRVGAKPPRTGCAVMDGSRVEKQAAGPMRDQHCWSRKGAHGVEKQSGGMQRHVLVQGATSDGGEGDWDGDFTIGAGVSGDEGDGSADMATTEPCDATAYGRALSPDEAAGGHAVPSRLALLIRCCRHGRAECEGRGTGGVEMKKEARFGYRR